MDTTVSAPPEPALSTLADLPFHVAGRFPKPLLVGRAAAAGVRGWSTAEFFDRVRDAALGLQGLGLARGDRLAIVSESRPEWLVADLAAQTLGIVTVPIYPTLAPAQARYIARDSGARCAVASTVEQARKLWDGRAELPALERVLVFEAPAGGSDPFLSFDRVVADGHARIVGGWGAGREYREQAATVRPGDLATLIYTSGTTGEPKGVMLTHGNIVANVKSCLQVLPVTHEDVALSFLPLSHSFERTVAYIYLAAGVTIVFAESLETVARDLALVRPTIMTGVPRVFEKFYARVHESVAAQPALRRALFRWAVRAASARRHGRRTPAAWLAPLADRLVLAKIRARLGGRLRYAVSGSAPLPRHVGEFFHAIGLPIIEGYGLTETAPVLTVNPFEAPRLGTVGRPIPDVEIRIAPDGEILARGPNIMAGYYNRPADTQEVLRDGWLHTGDVGEFDADGYLRITDRKKDLIITSGGKHVAPQPLEARLKASPLVAEAVVLGDRRKFPAALIVPDFAALERRLAELGRPGGAREELVTRPDVVSLYQEIVDALNHELAQFERIKRFALLPRELSIESGELTPTLKVRRRVVEERWRDTIERLYADAGSAPE